MRTTKQRLHTERLENRQLLTCAAWDLPPLLESAPTEAAALHGPLQTETGSVTDDHGDDANTATLVGVPSVVAGELETFGDIDWFRFSAQAGRRYQLTTSLSTLYDSVLQLYGDNGATLLASNDDCGWDFASRIDWIAPSDGEYFVEVLGYAGDTGTYTLSLVTDDHGDGPDHATSTNVGSTTAGAIESYDDFDWFSFHAEAGKTYRFATSLESLGDSYLQLFGSNGFVEIASNDDSGKSYASRITWTAPTSDSYYIVVSGVNGLGSYDLDIDLLGDINRDGVVGAADIDLLYEAASSESLLVRHDLDDDGMVDRQDVQHLVRRILGSSFGDTNLDGIFDSADLVQVMTAGEYNDTIVGNSTWSEGDWNGDGEFDSGDLLLALTDGDFVLEADDRFEDNDSLSQAAFLGAIAQPQTLSGLKLLDSVDWFHFQTEWTGNSESQLSITFEHTQGDLDLELYNGDGWLVRDSKGMEDMELVSLAGLPAGDYFLKVYGYQGADNSSYALNINPGEELEGGSGGTLWLNFDGVSITPEELAEWSYDWDFHWRNLDPERDGIRVDRFLNETAGHSQREAIIAQIVANVQQDLEPYGILVQRWAGTAVEGLGDTTIFVGASTLEHPHVAGDIDYGNNNGTDIAFVGNEWWGNADSTALAMSDVVLHEAGHTYGLFHVDTTVGGQALPESMGLRYSVSDPSQWVQDTTFMNRTFVEYLNHGDHRGYQNAHQTMLSNFGLANSVPVDEVVRYSLSDTGVFTVVASDAADIILGHELDGGAFELEINGQFIQLGEGVEELRIYTNGDSRDQIELATDLALQIFVDEQDNADLIHDTKPADSWATPHPMAI